jgi:hypothetical protein
MSTKKLETFTVQQRRKRGETVYAMLTNRWEVRAECDSCRLDVVVHLMNLFRLHGPAHSLWDKTIPCPRFMGVTRCAGRMVYKAKPPQAPTFAYLAPMRIRRELGRDASGADRVEWIDPAELDNGPWRDKLGPQPPDPE